jgi:hypothetical protein
MAPERRRLTRNGARFKKLVERRRGRFALDTDRVYQYKQWE